MLFNEGGESCVTKAVKRAYIILLWEICGAILITNDGKYNTINC